jgi:hypothetical protein
MSSNCRRMGENGWMRAKQPIFMVGGFFSPSATGEFLKLRPVIKHRASGVNDDQAMAFGEVVDESFFRSGIPCLGGSVGTEGVEIAENHRVRGKGIRFQVGDLFLDIHDEASGFFERCLDGGCGFPPVVVVGSAQDEDLDFGLLSRHGLGGQAGDSSEQEHTDGSIHVTGKIHMPRGLSFGLGQW